MGFEPVADGIEEATGVIQIRRVGQRLQRSPREVADFLEPDFLRQRAAPDAQQGEYPPLVVERFGREGGTQFPGILGVERGGVAVGAGDGRVLPDVGLRTSVGFVRAQTQAHRAQEARFDAHGRRDQPQQTLRTLAQGAPVGDRGTAGPLPRDELPIAPQHRRTAFGRTGQQRHRPTTGRHDAPAEIEPGIALVRRPRRQATEIAQHQHDAARRCSITPRRGRAQQTRLVQAFVEHGLFQILNREQPRQFAAHLVLIGPVGHQMLAAVDDELQARPPPAALLARQAIQPLAATQTAHDQVDVDLPPLARLGQSDAQARLQFAPRCEQADGGRGFGSVAPHDRFGRNQPAFRAGFLGNDGLVAFETPEGDI